MQQVCNWQLSAVLFKYTTASIYPLCTLTLWQRDENGEFLHLSATALKALTGEVNNTGYFVTVVPVIYIYIYTHTRQQVKASELL